MAETDTRGTSNRLKPIASTPFVIVGRRSHYERNPIPCPKLGSTYPANLNNPTSEIEITFPQFCRLPVELQLLIWHFFAQPRFVEIWNSYPLDDFPANILFSPDPWTKYVAPYEVNWHGRTNEPDPVPTISKICQASRKIFLEQYRLYIPYNRATAGENLPIFADPKLHFQDYAKAKKGERTFPVWVNPQIDTVYLNIISERVEGREQCVVVKFAEYLDRRIEEETRHEKDQKARKRLEKSWQIRNLATNRNYMSWWWWHTEYENRTTCFPHLLFPCLTSILCIQDVDSEELQQRIITNPETPEEFSVWQKVSQEMNHDLAFMKVMKPPFCDGNCLKVDVAIGRGDCRHSAIDVREGLDMQGPLPDTQSYGFNIRENGEIDYNRETHWHKFPKRLSTQKFPGLNPLFMLQELHPRKRCEGLRRVMEYLGEQ